MVIKRKKEAVTFLDNFTKYANFDGQKYYLTLETDNPNGTLTIMKYNNGEFTYHRKNELYWDIKEIKTDIDMLTDIIWGFRKAINECIKSKVG
ncbi:hypothetical protein QFZ28_004339 [Neobacillus niacini]|uniref:hypothetical protein n=1 Tax=Neobacillus niacini TaxID=86668 RepID=UPI0027860915|nr:hypothetical protein [Neobacillus niacini]MDQ1003939.1 hypothetical protein [Neobacillus niacini]